MTNPQYDNDDLIYDDLPDDPYSNSAVYDISKITFKNSRKKENNQDNQWID